MALRKQELMGTILTGLSWLQVQCSLGGSLHMLDTNTFSQDFFRLLLNEVFALDLVEMDKLQANFPAIDLGDESAKRCFQVTSDGGSSKIQDTLNAFERHKLQGRFGQLQILVIGERRESYKAIQVPPGLPFDWEEDVFGTKELMQIIGGLDVDRMERVARVVEREMPFPSSQPRVHPASAQEERVSCCHIPLKLRKDPRTNKVEQSEFERVLEILFPPFYCAFGYAWQTTTYRDFVFLLTLDEDDREVEPGHVQWHFLHP